nr:RagB/SusD family nutrient uptake outer membrane protein [Chryseobacterium taklimakanense]
MLSGRIELWGEGFRIFDLKRLAQGLDRTGSNHNEVVLNSVYTVAPSAKRWQYLIPKSEIDASGGVVVQNEK